MQRGQFEIRIIVLLNKEEEKWIKKRNNGKATNLTVCVGNIVMNTNYYSNALVITTISYYCDTYLFLKYMTIISMKALH